MSVVGILAAERHRRLTGEGQLVKIALKDVALATTGHLGNIAEVAINGVDRPRYGNYLYGAFGRDFETKDGKRLMIVGLTARQWSGIKQAMGNHERLDSAANELGLDFELEGDRFEGRKAIAEIIEPWFGARTYNQVVNIFDECGVCWGPYRTFKEMLATDPDCSEENPLFRKVDHPGTEPYLTPSSPLCFGAFGDPTHVRAPMLGEHTVEILSDDLGLTAAQIDRLRDDGIVEGLRS